MSEPSKLWIRLADILRSGCRNIFRGGSSLNTKSCHGRKTWCSDAPIRSHHPEAGTAISGQAGLQKTRRGGSRLTWRSRRSATTKRRPLNQVIVRLPDIIRPRANGFRCPVGLMPGRRKSATHSYFQGRNGALSCGVFTMAGRLSGRVLAAPVAPAFRIIPTSQDGSEPHTGTSGK